MFPFNCVSFLIRVQSLPSKNGDVPPCGGQVVIVNIVVQHERRQAVDGPLAR